jgi:hypothetical protein
LVLGEQFVLSRSLVHFERIPRPRASSQTLAMKAATLAARSSTPFARPGLHLDWGESHIGIWSWDLEQLTVMGVPANSWAVPESALDDAPAANGYRLLTRSEGYEGQIWAGGELAASRFWAAQPSPQDIAVFQRSVAQASEARPAARPDGAPARALFSLRQAVDSGRVRPVHLATALAILLFLPLSSTAGSYLRTALELSSVREAQSALAEASTGQYQALERYRNRAQRLAIYSRELDRPNPLAAAADIAEVAAELGAQIASFRIEPDRLTTRITTPANIDPADLVRALESRETLGDVRLSRSDNAPAWEVQARVTPPARGRS